MSTTVNHSERQPKSSAVTRWFADNGLLIVIVIALALLPFILALIDGQSMSSLIANESGRAKFIQGLMIEVFILAVFAISYDMVLGVAGLLSFGHAMFFAVGAYLTGILLKSAGWPLWMTLLAVIGAGFLQAMLFGIVLPRVQGITFALVTLGFAAVFDIMIKSRELAEFTGADVGLQGIPRPDLLNPNTQRLRFYFVALIFAIAVYLFYRRFVNSPTGRVCVAGRENEGRARMLGYNIFYYQLIALTIASITAALAGFLQALYKPIVSPEIATLGFTVDGLLMVLIGGIGTLSGAMIGAGVFRLMDFYFAKWFGENASFLIGVIYVAIVIFLPYGIVGTWQRRSVSRERGWRRLWGLLGRG